ncbi:hypothetical protein SAY86_016929 [Trapa natans]|uniref:Peptidase A1 domain-containing protein n=1 Tax=Trapa natans TaxID=22666 RepID=A0AAN7M519_TRANT|nr:hypothetical protein SAY86_016929 [Trapa natans]
MAFSASMISVFSFFIVFWPLIHQFRAHNLGSPKAFLFPVTKDASTLQYLTQIRLGGSIPLTLVLDLNGRHLWTSLAPSTRPLVPFRSFHCISADGKNMRGGTVCGVVSENSVSGATAVSELSEGAVAFVSSQRSSIPAIHQLLLAHAPSSLLSRLTIGARGMLGMGRAPTALPEQLSAAASGGDRRFFLCLSESDGVIVAGGDWPYSSSPPLRGDVSKLMVYAPLSTSERETTGEYSLNLKAIEVNRERLTLNLNSSSLLLSTVVPFMTMQSAIYTAFTGAFAKAAAAMNMTRIQGRPSDHFELCFSSDSISKTPKVGSLVPEIDFVLQSEIVRWRIHGRNSMVRVNDEVTCLGVRDGGSEQRSGVVMGGHQLENVLMEFDLGASMVGFSRSLLLSQRSCSDFSLSSSLTASL